MRGAWIEMGTATCGNGEKARRSPCGERGLKSEKPPTLDAVTSSRSPCGERGLKYSNNAPFSLAAYRRSPCGERGLKWGICHRLERSSSVAPRAGSVD